MYIREETVGSALGELAHHKTMETPAAAVLWLRRLQAPSSVVFQRNRHEGKGCWLWPYSSIRGMLRGVRHSTRPIPCDDLSGEPHGHRRGIGFPEVVLDIQEDQNSLQNAQPIVMGNMLKCRWSLCRANRRKILHSGECNTSSTACIGSGFRSGRLRHQISSPTR